MTTATRRAPRQRSAPAPAVTSQQRRSAVLALIGRGLDLEPTPRPAEPYAAMCRDHRAVSLSLHQSLIRARAHSAPSTAAYEADIDAVLASTTTCPDCQRYATGHLAMAHDLAGALGLLPDIRPARPGRGWIDAHDPATTGRPTPISTTAGDPR